MAAAFEQAGLAASERVAVVLPDGPEMATVVVATMACAACAPLNPTYRADEFRFFPEDLGARAVILKRGEVGPLRDVVRQLGLVTLEIDVDPAQPAGRFGLGAAVGTDPSARSARALQGLRELALVLHTSGTTARPKIV